MSTTMRAISQDEIIQAESGCKNCNIQETLNIILSEVKALRLERLPASEEQLLMLLPAIFEIFRDVPFTAAWLLEEALDDPAILKIIQDLLPEPTVKRLSGLLKRSIGTYGEFTLSIVNKHSRDGILFLVTL